MNKGILLFIGGMATGAAGAYIFLKRYFETRMEDEIYAVKEYYDDKLRDALEAIPGDSCDDSTDVQEKRVNERVEAIRAHREASQSVDADVEPDYEEIIEKLNYNKYSTKSSENKDKPYIISMEEYDTNRNYEKFVMTYFSEDEVLMNDENERAVEDPDLEVGRYNLDSMDPSTCDEIYIRNEKLGCDYQITLSIASFADYVGPGEEDDE